MMRILMTYLIRDKGGPCGVLLLSQKMDTVTRHPNLNDAVCI